jgi:acyl CoA:acetate/3-ketoacid CoA transferase alpha subunit
MAKSLKLKMMLRQGILSDIEASQRQIDFYKFCYERSPKKSARRFLEEQITWEENSIQKLRRELAELREG